MKCSLVESSTGEVWAYLVLFEESGDAGGKLSDSSLLLRHHVGQVHLHLTHWGGDWLPWQHAPLKNAPTPTHHQFLSFQTHVGPHGTSGYCEGEPETDRRRGGEEREREQALLGS